MDNRRTALVTGGSRGIGRAIAQRLAADGMRVIVNYAARADAAAEVVREIETAGGSADAVRADVSDPLQVKRMAEEVGPVDVLVNNAGILRRGDLDAFSGDDFDEMCRINLGGIIHPTRIFSEGMRERRYGRIVNLTSIAAHGTAMAGTTFYAATKAAVILLTKRFALALGANGVTVNAVAPGFIMTDMVTAGRTAEEVAGVEAQFGEKAMMRRVGLPQDIAHGVSFLCSEGAGFVTAQTLTVDGGRTDYIGHP
jgi:3-oxoacyl-[acyl-carrier protein] reductase